MQLIASFALFGSLVGVATAPSFFATPANGAAIRLGGLRTTRIACRVERNPVIPQVGAGSRLTPRDVVLAVDRGALHFRYALVWETAKHQELGAAVAAWAQDDPAPAYLHISGRTAASRSGGQESFVVFLPVGKHEAVRAQVDVARNGAATLNARSLALVSEHRGH